VVNLKWRLGINSVTLKQAPLEEAIGIAGEVGYDGFGFWAKDLRQYVKEQNRVRDLANLLTSSNLEACELLAVRKWQEVPVEQFDDAEQEARFVFDLAQQIGAPIVTSPAGAVTHSLGGWAHRLRKICDIASRYGITIALEFIHGRSIQDLSSAVKIVRATKRSNVGVLLDLFHFYKTGSSLADLSTCRPGEIALVHIDDARSKPLQDLRDKDRLFPGDGVIPISKIVSILRRIKYEGYFSVEVLNDDYWEMDATEVARISLEKTRSFLNQ